MNTYMAHSMPAVMHKDLWIQSLAQDFKMSMSEPFFKNKWKFVSSFCLIWQGSEKARIRYSLILNWRLPLATILYGCRVLSFYQSASMCPLQWEGEPLKINTKCTNMACFLDFLFAWYCYPSAHSSEPLPLLKCLLPVTLAKKFHILSKPKNKLCKMSLAWVQGISFLWIF